jgi:hypothetical protein
LPDVTVSVDGLIAAVHRTGNEYADITVPLPARPRASGAALTLTVSNTFVPGPSDKRALGVMIDRAKCSPEPGSGVRPPMRSIVAAAAGAAVFGAGLALIGLGALGTALGLALLASLQAVPLHLGFGIFGDYTDRALWLAVWIAAAMVITVRGGERLRRCPFTTSGRIVIAIAAGALYLKLLALTHPAKLPIDVVFHAHRLQWVLDGRLFFTQPMPSGVRFPYAVGLYVFSAPFTLLTDDYALLLRVVVTAAEAVGALLVYLLVSRVWQDHLAAVMASSLFHFVPRTYEIVGNANLTNAFGQSLALGVLAAAVLWPLGRVSWRSVSAFTVITACALLSHISVLTTLGVILMSLALLYWWRGGPALRAPASIIVTGLAAATLLSVVLYYGHFGDAYRSAMRVRAAAPAADTAPSSTAASQNSGQPTVTAKVMEAGRLTVAAIGLPIFLLSLGGYVPFLARGIGDRLSLAVLALLITLVALTGAVVLTPVERSFQRDAAEFITPITHAPNPAAINLAGAGAAAAWRAGWAGRLAGTALMVAAAHVGFTCWIGWLG